MVSQGTSLETQVMEGLRGRGLRASLKGNMPILRDLKLSGDKIQIT